MIKQSDYSIQFPIQKFTDHVKTRHPAIEELESRYPDLKDWLIYILIYELRMENVYLQITHDHHDMIALIRGKYWYKINVVIEDDLGLRIERYDTERGDSDIGPNEGYTFGAINRLLDMVKANDPAADADLHN